MTATSTMAPTSKPSPAFRRSNSRKDVVKKHSEYYVPDGNVVIRAQNTLFKVDLNILHQKSSVLRGITPPQYAGNTRLWGFDDTNPFLLHDVKAIDFTRLLWILYPKEPGSYKATTVDEWLSILELSDKLQIPDVRTLAIMHLYELPIEPVRKIAIWKKHRLPPSLLAPSYIELCQRVEPLPLAVAMGLGIETFTKLAAARDKLHQRAGCGRCRCHSPEEKEAIAVEVVHSVFFDEGL